MATSPKPFRKSQAASVLAYLQGMTAGLTAHGAPGGGATLPVSGKTEAVPALVIELTGYQTVYEAVDETWHAHQLALQAREAIAPQATARCMATRDALMGTAGKKSQALADYTIAPNKTPDPLTAEELVARAAKGKVTSAALGSLTPAEKKAIKDQLAAIGDAAVAAHVGAKVAASPSPASQVVASPVAASPVAASQVVASPVAASAPATGK